MKKTLCTILSVIILATSTVTSVYAGNTDTVSLKATTVKSFNRTSVKSGKLIIKSVKGASKYEVQYSNNRKFKNSKSLNRCKKVTSKTKTIILSDSSIIKHSKDVYVRVRYNKNKRWSAWSKCYKLKSGKKFYTSKKYKSEVSKQRYYNVYWVNDEKEWFTDKAKANARQREIIEANINGDYSVVGNSGLTTKCETITIPAHYEYTWYKR